MRAMWRRYGRVGKRRGAIFIAVLVATSLVVVSSNSPVPAIKPAVGGGASSFPNPLAWLGIHWPGSSGSSGKLPPTPQQQAGSAAGKAHYVPADQTRGKKKAAGRPATPAPGELPAYSPHGVSVKPHKTAPLSGDHSFDPKTSVPIPSAASATSDVYRNTDGSYTRRAYAGPVNYRASDGSWQPIDTTLRSGPDGRLTDAANAMAPEFAATAADPALATLTMRGGQRIAFGLSGAAAVPGSVSGSTATYAGVFPSTDLVLQSVPGGVKQSLVLHSADAATSWTFPLDLHGLSASVDDSDGSVEFRTPSGDVVARVPAGYMSDSKYDPHSRIPAMSYAVRYRIVDQGSGPALEMSIDADWLRDPKRVFPVIVDPTVNERVSASTSANTTHSGNNSGLQSLWVGTPDGGTEKAYSFLQFANFGVNYAGNHITAATLHLFDYWAWTCTPNTFSVNRVTSSWTPSGVTSYPGPSFDGNALGSAKLDPGAACTNTGGNPGIGTWMAVPLQAQTFDSWVTGAGSNFGLAVTASQSTSSQWKIFDSVNAPNPPYLEVTYTPDVAPQVDTQYPLNNHNLTTLTPELLASGHDPDAWPGGLQYLFTIYDLNSNQIASSGLLGAGRWLVPSGVLKWGSAYYYTVQTYDGYTYSDNPVFNYLTTGVPQPPITSKLSQNGGPQGFDPSVGNYTTSAVDATVATVGPTLSVDRSYNSLDPRVSGAFGAGWSSQFDALVTEQKDPAGAVTGAVVRYPDGQEAAFGRNADGTFNEPLGRYASFRAVAGRYALTDKNGTVYSFTTHVATDYVLTSIADALGRTETFGYLGGQLTTATAASGRALHLTWTTPSGASAPHVASVKTDPATAGDASSSLTWTYAYTADQLTGVCGPVSGTACTSYTYTTGSQARSAVLDADPHSYWRLSESSGDTAASSVLANEGTDRATYLNVALGQPGAFPGSTATSAGFNGSTSYVQLPDSLVNNAAYQSVGLWFKTTTGNGVLFSYQTDPITNPNTVGDYTPALYIGSDGRLFGQFWTGGVGPIGTTGAVTDGSWHYAMLVAAGNSQTLYLDGAQVGTKSDPIQPTGQIRGYVGAGFLGGAWPDESHFSGTDNHGYPTYFTGSIADVVSYLQPVSPAAVAQIWHSGRQSTQFLASTTRPTSVVAAQVVYDPSTAVVSQVTDSNGGVWHLGAPTVTGTSQVYAASVLGSNAIGYWRMGESGGQQGVNQARTAAVLTYNAVTLGSEGVFGAGEDTAASFDGSSSYAAADNNTLNGASASVELWFSTTRPGAVLLSDQSAFEPDPEDTDPGETATPDLWIGSDGKLYGNFWPVQSSSAAVTDGKWHQVVLSFEATGQQDDWVNAQVKTTMYLDGVQVATEVDPFRGMWGQSFIVGAGRTDEFGETGTLPTDSALYFQGRIDEFSTYQRALPTQEVAAHYAGYKSSTGIAPMRTVQVTDPGGKTIGYDYDVLNGDRIIRQTDALGNATTYGYDVGGFQRSVTDPNGNSVVTGHDVRGNVISQSTCQLQGSSSCSTVYYTYYPDATTARPAPDPRNDLLLSQRDGRSSSATDNTYLSTYGYDDKGNRTSIITPPVDGYPNGRTTTVTYTDGATVAATDGGFAPAGLPATSTSPGGAVTRITYYRSGDIASVTDAAGAVTQYTYDGLGRALSKTTLSGAVPTVPPSPGDNLIVDPGVETSTDGTTPDGWQSSSWGTNTASFTYENYGHTGDRSVSVRVTSYTDGDAKWYADPVPVTAGGQYTYSDFYQSPVATRVLAAYTTGGSTTYVELPEAPAAASWSGYTATLTAPAGATDVTVYHLLDKVGSLTIDDVSLLPGLSAIANPGVETSTDGTTPDGWQNSSWGTNTVSFTYEDDGHAGGKSVKTTVTSYTDGDAKWYADPVPVTAGRQYTYSDFYQSPVATRVVAAYTTGGSTTYVELPEAPAAASWSGYMATLTAPAGATDVAVYHLLDRVGSLSIDDVSLLPGLSAIANPGVETSTDGTTPDGWQSSSWGTNTVSFTYEDDGHAGGKSVKTTVTSYTDGDAKWYFNPVTGLREGQRYHFSAWLKSNTEPQAVADFTMADGSDVYTTLSPPSADATSWQQYTTDFAAPPGAQAVTVFLMLSSIGWLETDDYDITTNPAVHLTTTYAYNQLGMVTSQTDPPVTNRVTGAVHTAVTTTDYNLDAQVTQRTTADATGGDASRTVHMSYNDKGQVETSTDAASSTTSYGYDVYGNQTSVTDAAGRVTLIAYDANGHELTRTLKDYTGDPNNPSPPTDLVVSSKAYDPAGRLASDTDAMGWVTSYTYTDNGLLADVVRDGQPNGGYHLMDNVYDAAGNLTTRYTHDAVQVVDYTVDAANRTTATTVWNGDHQDRTSYTYAADDAVLSSALSTITWDDDGNEIVTPSSTTDNTYDPLGRLLTRTVHGDGSAQFTTTWMRDERGLATSMTDPMGNVTSYANDEVGHTVVTTAPVVDVEIDSGTSVAAHPVSMVGYDTFGEETEKSDPDGNVTTTGYDAAGRVVSTTLPSYTPPGTSVPIVPVITRSYDLQGQLQTATDPLGKQTTYTYDQLGHTASVTAPNGGVTRYVNDLIGDVLSTTDPTGAVNQATYDVIGRKVTTTQVVRQPSPAAYTTTYDYNQLVNPIDAISPRYTKVTSPSGATTVTEPDSVGNIVSVTDGAGNQTRYTYDAAGHKIGTQLPDGSQEIVTYDVAGRAVQTTSLDTAGNTTSTTSSEYDADGRVTASTDALGHTTTFGYDALGHTTSETQPVSDTSSITTSFGYDATGQRTRFTDGRGNPFLTTYNSWGMPESQIEPATAAAPDPADRTWTLSYDADGRVATSQAPGGVVVGNTYDDAGNLTGQEGTGADAPTEARSFGYDLAGRLTSASAPGGTDTFGYDDRGLLLAADGPSGASSFGYDGQARMTSRTDAAGTATYAYDNADRLAQMADPSTGVDLSFTYNAMSQVSRIAYGPDGNTRTLGYDSAHRLASDTLAEPSGSTIASIAYGYDPAGDLTSKTTTGMAGATTHTYGYDYAGRLTSWDNGTTTVGFTYDNSGNRTSAGGATFTYDARNQLVTANGSTYTYTPRGTIASVSGGSGKVTSTSDAFDQTITDGDRSYSYDSIGRLIQTATSGTIDRTLSYTGQGNGVASDGSFTYSRDPGGQLVGEKGSGDGVLAWTDQHTDVVGQFSASGTLSGSTSYDPFGTVLTSAGMLGNLGFQSGWTDPSSDKVNMLARWYNPGIGQFTSRDSVGLDPVPSSVSANRVAYVNDSPLDDVDPSGHCGRWAVWCNVKAAGSAVIHKADQALDWSVHKVEQAWDWGVNKLEDAWNWADQQVQHAYDEGKKIENKVVDDAKHAASTFISTVHDAAHQVAQQAHDLAGKVSHAATKIANETVDLAGKAGKWIDEHKKQIIAGVAGLAVGIGVFAGCMALSLGVGSVGCAAIAGAAGGAVAGAIGCPAGMSKVKCAAIGAAGGAVAGAVGAIAVPAIAAGAAALGAGSTMAGIIGGSLGGALAGATGDITSQLIGTGKVDWTSVATSAAIGGVMGGIGGAFGGCHSFAPTTKVWMANGTAKAIKDVKLGDKVTATDPTTGKTTQQAVVALHDNHDTDLADVTVTGTDHRMSVVRTTQHHLFWDATAGAWIAAADLVAGHQLRSEDGSTETVAAVHSYTAAADMRDLTVDTDHTYYVIAGDEPVLVHNCGGGVDANGSPCACSSPRPITATIDAVEHPDAAIHAYEQGLDGAKWTVDRPGAEARRATSLRGTRTVPGFDRDELPPAVVEEGGAGAHVKPIVPRDNRGSGSSAFGAQIRDVPDGGTFIMRIENLEDIGVQ